MANQQPDLIPDQPAGSAGPVPSQVVPASAGVPQPIPQPGLQPEGTLPPVAQESGGPAVPASPSGVRITEYSSGRKRRGLAKLALLVLLPVGLAVGGALGVSQFLAEGAYRAERGVLVSIPMHNTNWQDLGSVFEPLVSLPVKTTTGYQDNQFLLDSGAVISSLPREWAEKTGQDLAFLQRSTFRGFGGATSFAYRGEMMILLGETEVSLPVVFTEAAGTKSLLGRKGFFEDYSIYFNHQERQIEIRE